MHVRRGTLLTLLISTLSGCITPIDTTHLKLPNPSAPPRYADARLFVDEARTRLASRLNETDQFQRATKTGVGGGLVAVGAAAAFKAPADVILGILTGVGVSYSANTQSNPPAMSDALHAGLENLECIESAGDAAEGSRTTLQAQQPRLDGAIARVTSAISAVASRRNEIETDLRGLKATKVSKARTAAIKTTQAELDTYNAAIQLAQTKVDAGTDRSAQITGYLAAYDPVPQAMTTATRDTVYAVNAEMRQKVPNVEKIFTVATQMQSVFSAGAGLRTSISATANGFRPAVDAHSDQRDPLLDRLDSASNQLIQVLKEIAAPPATPPSIAAITSCHAQFPQDAPIALAFTSPVSLPAGGTAEVGITSGAWVDPRWTSAVPTDITWSFSPVRGTLTLTAPATAKAGSYTLKLVDLQNHVSPEFTVTVSAAPAKAADAAGGATSSSNGGAQPKTPPVSP